MMLKHLRSLAVVLSVAVLAAGCADNPITDTIGDWFKGGNTKSKLRGERISVMTIDETLRIDDSLASVPVVLPAPYRNDAWPEPGGYASNAMYHLEAPGPLHQAWTADAGKASDQDSRLT